MRYTNTNSFIFFPVRTNCLIFKFCNFHHVAKIIALRNIQNDSGFVNALARLFEIETKIYCMNFK